MRISIFFGLIFLISTNCFAQRNEQVKKLVSQGIELHDKGDYEGAIKKYDEALGIDPNDLDANYEKAYSCQLAKRYDDCITICKFIIKNFPGDPILKQVYEVYGSAVDDSGNSSDALKIYDDGLKLFPDYYLLHFNKGIVFMKQKNYDDAINSYSLALKNNALHPSSNYYLAYLLKSGNRVPSMLAFMTYIVIQPEGERAKSAFDAINEILYQNIKKQGNNTTISISTELLDQSKNKKIENNFASVEFIFSLLGATDDSKELDSLNKTPAGKLDFKLQMLINSLSENLKDGKGFYWEHYVPFFIEMKNKNYTIVLSNLIYRASGDSDSIAWIDDNSTTVKEFYDWVQKYNWSKL